MTRTEWRVFTLPDGMQVASGDASNDQEAIREGMHYGEQYAQDGRVRVTVNEGNRIVLLCSMAHRKGQQ
jgi:hypothetical protein